MNTTSTFNPLSEIATRIRELREIMGFSVEQMAEKCIWMIEHPEETVQMGKNARAFAEEYFNSVNINQRIYDILRDTVEE